jgi:NAD(P)-dependent dehydrogenase (short-subunit alcohol dehydrogenase family)
MYRAALITGGAKRLGREMALALARRKIDVAVHYNGSVDDAAETISRAASYGVKAVSLQADLLDLEATQALVARASKALGKPLDVLVNNASIFEYDKLETATAEGWERHINSNLRAPFFLTQAFGDQVPKAGTDENGEVKATSAVINIVDQRVRKLTPEFMTYTIAKMGLWAFTQTAARSMAPATRVNAIGPGSTIIGERQTQDHFDNQRKATILQRGSNADEIVGAMNYLLDSSAMTGQLLNVDGGQHLGWQTPDIQG